MSENKKNVDVPHYSNDPKILHAFNTAMNVLALAGMSPVCIVVGLPGNGLVSCFQNEQVSLPVVNDVLKSITNGFDAVIEKRRNNRSDLN